MLTSTSLSNNTIFERPHSLKKTFETTQPENSRASFIEILSRSFQNTRLLVDLGELFIIVGCLGKIKNNRQN